MKFGTSYVARPVYILDIAVMINVYAIHVNRSILYFRRNATSTGTERYRQSARASIYTVKCKYRCQPFPCSLSAICWPQCKAAHTCLMRANLGPLRESSQCRHARLSDICCLNVSQRKLVLGDAGFRFETVLRAFYYSARFRDSNM